MIVIHFLGSLASLLLFAQHASGNVKFVVMKVNMDPEETFRYLNN